MIKALTTRGKQLLYIAVISAILALGVLGFEFGETLYRDHVESLVKISALTAALNATEKAIELRDLKQYEAAEVERRKKDALSKLADATANMSDADLLKNLKRLCDEQRVCDLNTSQDSTR